MNPNRSRPAPALEDLEGRMMLSGVHAASGLPVVAAQTLHTSATKTTMAVDAGTLGQPIAVTVSVRANSAAAGAPTGTVKIMDHGNLIQTLTLSPPSSGKSAVSAATVTLIQPPGGSAYYFGTHSFTATFVPNGGFAKSTVTKSFLVPKPPATVLADGVKVTTIAQGTGPAIQAGQKASVLYSGYLASTGKLFDDSLSHGTSPLQFTVGAQQVVPGFDEGTSGMQVGETRIVQIPSGQGYGATANGPIPANSNLIFVVTLKAIS